LSASGGCPYRAELLIHLRRMRDSPPLVKGGDLCKSAKKRTITLRPVIASEPKP